MEEKALNIQKGAAVVPTPLTATTHEVGVLGSKVGLKEQKAAVNLEQPPFEFSQLRRLTHHKHPSAEGLLSAGQG